MASGKAKGCRMIASQRGSDMLRHVPECTQHDSTAVATGVSGHQQPCHHLTYSNTCLNQHESKPQPRTGSASGFDPVAAEKAVLATTSAAAAIWAGRRVAAESEGERAWGFLYCPSKPASTAPCMAGLALSHAMSELGGMPGLLALALPTGTCKRAGSTML